MATRAVIVVAQASVVNYSNDSRKTRFETSVYSTAYAAGYAVGYADGLAAGTTGGIAQGYTKAQVVNG